jgi:hypothetical protein
MPFSFVGQVGPQGPTADGTTNAVVRQGKFGELDVSELQPRYYEQAYRGNVFFAANQAAATFAANGLTTVSCVGLCVYNPPNSPKNIVPLQFEVLVTNVVTNTPDVQILANVSSAFSNAVPVSATAITPQSTLGPGKATSIAICAQSLTFAANTVIWKGLFNAYVTTTVATAIPTENYSFLEVGGSLIIPPGTGMAMICSNASTGILSATWMEITV